MPNVLQKTPIEIQALASPAFLERGCVNVIGLETIKEQSGARWPRVCDNVYERLETLLRQRLGPTDVFARLNDSSYIVTMPSADPDDINAVCLRIAYDLCNNLLGKCDISQLRVSKASNGGEHQLILKPLTSENVATLVEKAGILGISFGGNASASTYDSNTIISADETDMGIGAKALTIAHQYVPVWSSVNNAITTYICEPRQVMSLDFPRRNVMVPQLTLKERIRVEISSLREGIGKLAHHIETGNRFILGVQVSFDVLGAPAGRMEYLNECRNLSHEYRQYLDFILTDIPPGIAQTRLHDLTNTLRPFARSISATVAPGTRNFSPYQGIGLRVIGYHKREFTFEHHFLAEDAMVLVQAARNLKVGTFMLGINKLTTLNTAHDAGIQTLSGMAIAPAGPEPKSMTRLSWEEIQSSHELLKA